MISIYKSAEVKPHIIQLLKNEGLNITEDNIIPIQSKVVTSKEIITWGDKDRIGIREAKINQIF